MTDLQVARVPSRPLAALFSAFVLLAAPSTDPQATAQDRLTLPFKPEVGSRTGYAIVKTKRRSAGHRLERDLKTTSEAELTLLAENDQGFLFRFVIRGTAATTPGARQPKLDRLLSRMAGITSGVPLVYQADGAGTPLYLINTKEVMQAFRAMLPELRAVVRDLAREGIVPPAERAKLEASVQGTFDALTSLSDRELAAVVLEEVRLLFAATGRDFPIGRKESFETETTIPLIGQAIRVAGERRIKSLDQDAGIAVVGIETVYDRTQLLEALAEAAGNAAGSEAAEAERHLQTGLLALDEFRVEESSLHMVDLENGAPLALRHQRTIDLGDKTVVEVTKIRRIRQ